MMKYKIDKVMEMINNEGYVLLSLNGIDDHNNVGFSVTALDEIESSIVENTKEVLVDFLEYMNDNWQFYKNYDDIYDNYLLKNEIKK